MNRRMLLLSGVASTAVAANLSGCASPSVEDYATEKPVLDLRTYFNGVVDAWGIFTVVACLCVVNVRVPTLVHARVRVKQPSR